MKRHFAGDDYNLKPKKTQKVETQPIQNSVDPVDTPMNHNQLQPMEISTNRILQQSTHGHAVQLPTTQLSSFQQHAFQHYLQIQPLEIFKENDLEELKELVAIFLRHQPQSPFSNSEWSEENNFEPEEIRICALAKAGDYVTLTKIYHATLMKESDHRKFVALMYAIVNGHRNIVNYLLGCRIRKVSTSINLNNISDVITGSEILLINDNLSNYYLRFKNKQGKYEQIALNIQQHSMIIYFANEEKFDGTISNSLYLNNCIKKLINSNPNAAPFLNNMQISNEQKDGALYYALVNQHFSIAIDLLETFILDAENQSVLSVDVLENLPLDIKLVRSNTSEDRYTNCIRYLYKLAAQFGCGELILKLLNNHIEKLTFHCHVLALKEAVKNNHFTIIDYCLELPVWSDADVEVIFEYAFKSNNFEMQRHLLDKDKKYFYSLFSKHNNYEIRIMFNASHYELFKQELIDKIKSNSGKLLILVPYEEYYILVVSHPMDGYKEMEIKKAEDSNFKLIAKFIQTFLKKRPSLIYQYGSMTDLCIFKTNSVETRELRKILLTLGANIFTEHNPLRLIKHFQDYGDFDSTQRITNLRNISPNTFSCLDLFLQHQYFDFASDDDSLLEILAYNITLHERNDKLLLILYFLMTHPSINPEFNPHNDVNIQLITFIIEKGFSYVLKLLLKPHPFRLNIYQDNKEKIDNALLVAMQKKKYAVVEIVLQQLYCNGEEVNVLSELARGNLKDFYNFFINAKDDQRFQYYQRDAFKKADLQQLKLLLSLPETTPQLDNNTIIKQFARNFDLHAVALLLRDRRVLMSQSTEQWRYFFDDHDIYDEDRLQVLEFMKMYQFREARYNQSSFFNQTIEVLPEIFTRIENILLDVMSIESIKADSVPNKLLSTQ